ncbi:DUF1592 domain-containing protein [Luteolibacter pohnpeiensis]|uniref:DUF1592 domain-containing protein n=1 Tax=Luteolibacter pohnpeiensis TaxID=454153 RepID=A0A934VW07_9BACT|nr:DUF1592 domain-containing protein [Luteolibacter pohnpeiensis]MBK1882785.1 DUF1592 domain-containing protein [Luteolibacter pohnpeiensis]
MVFFRSHQLARHLAWIACVVPLGVSADPAQQFHDEIEPIFINYCYDCHGDGLSKGDLALDEYQSIDSMIANRSVWKRIRDHIDFRLMPPPDEYQPSDLERSKLVKWIDDAVFPIDPDHPDPGHVTLRRLNRTEYRNTIQDLLGANIKVDEILPPDDSGYGFDHIGDVLTISPLHLERYLDAAKEALDQAVHLKPMPFPQIKIEGNQLAGEGGEPSKEGWYFYGNGTASKEVNLPKPGRYLIKVIAGGTSGAGIAPKLDFLLEDEVMHTWDITAPIEAPKEYSTEITIESGNRFKVGAAFTNDFWDETIPDPNQRDRNVRLKRLVIEGPLDGPRQPKPARHRQIYGSREEGQDDRSYMLAVLDRFARRAFRRPPEPGEIEHYLVFLKTAEQNGENVDYAIRHALEAMLVSPAFLFHEEPKTGESHGDIRLISEYALASRLSYFLWSSMPDQQLFDLAASGKLRENLKAQVERMIASPKSGQFVENFAGQWLQLRDLQSIFPDNKIFPDYDGNLARSMATETLMLFSDVLHQNEPVDRLLDADYTFLNQKLAEHYGIDGIQGNEFRKVSLEGTERRGILNQGSVLTLTSYPRRTSPVLRGKYVLENILDTPPPPPPPNIPQLEAAGAHGKNLSLRQQMELHRSDPSCSSCHALMDPIGFGLENFNAVGAWRSEDRGKPIDSSGKLADGSTFANSTELRELISGKQRPLFHRALATKLLTYALGRGLEWYDRPAVDQIVLKAETEESRFIPLILAVIDSVPFQYQRD